MRRNLTLGGCAPAGAQWKFVAIGIVAFGGLFATACQTEQEGGSAPVTDETDTAAETTVPATPAAPPEDPEVTNARRSAESYLDLTGFSRTGLIEQLEFEGYPADKATIAVDSLAVDWMAEAVQSAENYVETTPFSHSGLVDQLAYEGFTPAEAEHGATTVLG